MVLSFRNLTCINFNKNRKLFGSSNHEKGKGELSWTKIIKVFTVLSPSFGFDFLYLFISFFSYFTWAFPIIRTHSLRQFWPWHHIASHLKRKENLLSWMQLPNSWCAWEPGLGHMPFPLDHSLKRDSMVGPAQVTCSQGVRRMELLT